MTREPNSSDLESAERDWADAPRVTVLLAAYNGMQYLGEQLESILDQADVNLEVVVSVDRSTDGTEHYVEQRAKSDSRIKVLPSGTRFGSAALNFYRLLREANWQNADYVAFADQDDVWFPTKLRRAAEVLSATGAAGYSSDVLSWDPSTDERTPLGKGAYAQTEWDHLFSSPGPGCTHVMTADFADELRHLVLARASIADLVEYHDWLDYALARATGGGWTIDDQPSMLYRQHGANQLGANRGLGAARQRIVALRQDWLWEQAALIADLVGQQESPPIQALHSRGLAARWRLLRLSRRLRRRPIEAWFLGLMSVVRSRRTTWHKA